MLVDFILADLFLIEPNIFDCISYVYDGVLGVHSFTLEKHGLASSLTLSGNV